MTLTLDTHAHLDPGRPSEDLAETGAVLAMTLSLDEAERGIDRHERQIAWGVGCHPRDAAAQAAFDPGRFDDLAEQALFIGEVGLNGESKVPMDRQLANFRHILAFAAGQPRLVSIHSYRAAGLVLAELHRTPISVPVLHWWTGTTEETRAAVDLGCYFSIHAAVARQNKFRKWVPSDRILLETDHSYHDPPAAIPCRITWAAHLVAQLLAMDVEAVHHLVWQNFGRILTMTGTREGFPETFQDVLRS